MKQQPKPGVTKKDGTVTENGIVIQNISIRPIQRSQLDIEKWRNYTRAAEGVNGTRVALYDLYSDVTLDGFLKRLIAKRILAVTKNKLRFVDKANKEVHEVNDLINNQQFRRLRKRIQLCKAWGISVIELMYVDNQFKIFDVPKKHILPKEGKIVFEQYGVDGFNYREAPFNKTVLEVGDWDDLGYLLEACAYVIYKRGNIADWANYAQIFGMPFREARYDGYNEAVRIQLENALEKAGSAAYAVLPKEADMIFHEAKGTSGSTELYDTLRKAMNEELLVHILGATETTTSSKSSGYAQSQTHAKTINEVAQDDKEDELAILNEQVIPILLNLGLIPDGGRFVYNEPVDIADAKAKVEIAILVKGAGVPVSDDYFYETSGIPRPDNYDELKAALLVEIVEDTPQPSTEKKKKEKAKGKEKLSFINELRFTLANFFDQAH